MYIYNIYVCIYIYNLFIFGCAECCCAGFFLLVASQGFSLVVEYSLRSLLLLQSTSSRERRLL